MPRITLSGRNGQRETREVFMDGEYIGRVIPTNRVTHDTWEAQDLNGHSHGSEWLSDFWAADAMVRSFARWIGPA